jgi:hypothetical protein
MPAAVTPNAATSANNVARWVWSLVMLRFLSLSEF